MRWEWKGTKQLFFSLGAANFPIWLTSDCRKKKKKNFLFSEKKGISGTVAGESRALCAGIPDVQTAVVPAQVFLGTGCQWWPHELQAEDCRHTVLTDTGLNTLSLSCIHSFSPVLWRQNYSLIISHCPRFWLVWKKVFLASHFCVFFSPVLPFFSQSITLHLV